MSEVVAGKELKGLGGWLVLFQIEIWSTLAGAAQMLVMFPIMGFVTSSLGSSDFFDMPGFNVSDFFKIYNSPFTYAFAGVVFVLILMCVIFFYKKKLVFRVFFIVESAVYLVGMAILYFYMIRSMADMYSSMFYGADSFTGVFTVFFAVAGLLPMIGIMTAFIIALFRSKRVKNTFS